MIFRQRTYKKLNMVRIITILLIFATVLIAAEIETYPLPDVYPVSENFSLIVNGQKVPVTQYVVKDNVQYHYSHFSFSGDIDINVECSETIESCEIRPKPFDIIADITDNSAIFSISEPQYLVLYINNLEKLILLADPMETDPPQVGGSDVTNILDYDVDTTGATIETEKFQQALDDVNSDGGGVLYIPAGLYTITRLYAKSNTTIYLEGGAVLRGTGEKTDYNEYSPGATQRITHVISVEGARDVRITGRGVIDAYGVTLADNVDDIRDANLKIRPISTENSSDVQVDGIIVRESTSWSVPFYYSDQIYVSNVKVLNYPGLKHSDGINMCASQHAVVEDCFVITGDDAFCSKDYGLEPTHDITFRNCVGYSNTRGVTLGMQAYYRLYDILYDGIYMVGTRDGIDFKHDDGYGDWENVVVKKVYVDECWGMPFNLHILEGGTIKDVSIENYTCYSDIAYSYIKGLDPNNNISNVAFTNLKINDEYITGPGQALININEYAENIVFALTDNDTTHALGRMEAEKMMLEQTVIQDNPDASGEKMVVCQSDSGEVSYFFTAATGNFEMNVSYWNENDSSAAYKLLVDGELVDHWNADIQEDTPFAIHTIQNIYIETSQKISVICVNGDAEITGVDYVEISHFDGYYTKELELEAETGTMGANWEIINDEQASDGQVIHHTGETSRENPPSEAKDIAKFSFNVEEGDYTFWLKIKHPDGEASDAVWIRLNDDGWHRWDQIAMGFPNNQYFWDKKDTTYSLAEGQNQLEIAGCEPGTLLDKLYLAQTETIPQDSTLYENYMEAEDAIVGSLWSILESNLASGRKYIVSETEESKSDAPSDTSKIAIFNFQAVPGDYKVWFRMRHPNSINDDSFWLRMSDGEWIRWNMIAYEKSDTEFHWDVCSEEFTLVPGINTLQVGLRENGSELDMVYISNYNQIPDYTSTSMDDKDLIVSETFQLHQNYPNPFNPKTQIRYSINKPCNVRLMVYNINGQSVAELVDDHKQSGHYSLLFDAANLASGIYYYSLEAGSEKLTCKMLLIK
ncbi:MAG: T9SS type A sorting domain-containing protein [Candidatus Marinimicrobia bacterium]|nr:T9SS type A sorting domain-containing protein [Candidatus Neomarinimicrobiota bacterium]